MIIWDGLKLKKSPA